MGLIAMPQTSVIIPVRNGERFIAEAVASVSVQLDTGDEIIVIDDGSDDGTCAILANLTAPGLWVLSSGGRGVSSARNVGLAAARGACIAFLDHDDLWPAGRQGALSAVLAADPTLDAVFGRITRRFEPDASKTPEAKITDHHAAMLVGSGLYRRRLIERIGGFAEDLHLGEDMDFYQRLLEAGMRRVLCDAPSLVRRHHAANATNDLAALAPARLKLLRRKLARCRAAAASVTE